MCFFMICSFLKQFWNKQFSFKMQKRSVRHILELSKDEKIQFLNSFDIVFSDCDGVIWQSTHQEVEGSGDGLNKLKQNGKAIVYITNNSTRSNEDFIQRFNAAGLETDLDHVIHPIRNIIDYLREIKFDGLIYCISTTHFRNVLKDAGFQVIDGPNKILDESFTDLAKNVFDNEPVRAVIVDVDLNLTSPKLIRADVYLRNPDCILIAGAADVIIPFGPINTIGPGAFLRALEHKSKRKAITFGKPGEALIAILRKQLEMTDFKRALFIGDNLECDIEFGKKCGFQTLVVLTGATKKEDLCMELSLDKTPDYYADSLADFVEFFKQMEQ